MESLFLMAASLIALGGAVFHGYVGGRIYMRHVRSSDLMPLTQSLSLVSWQMFTIFLLVSSATLICVAAKRPTVGQCAWRRLKRVSSALETARDVSHERQ